MALDITATVQDVYPPRVLVAVTGLTVGDLVTVDRRVNGEFTTLRGADQAETGDTSFLVYDAELPFGVPVRYRAIVESTVLGGNISTLDETYVLTGGKVALTDAITGNAAEVVITAWPTRTRDRAASTFNVNGRTVVVAGPLTSGSSDVELYTETDTSRESLLQLLETATSGVVQVRQPGGYSGVDAYLAVLSLQESRYSQDGTDQRRLWTLSVVEVDPWPASYQTLGTTLQDLADAYPAETLADIAADYATLLDLALADLS